MHETLHHKLNSAIMAWYAGGRIFLPFFFSLVPGLGSDPLGVVPKALCIHLSIVCVIQTEQPAGFACAMYDVRCEQ